MTKTPEELLAIMQGAKKPADFEVEKVTLAPVTEDPAIGPLVLKELKRTNKLLLQLRMVLLGEPLGADKNKDVEP